MLLAGALLTAGCGLHYRVPRRRARTARFGYLGGRGAQPPPAALCRDWRRAIGGRDAAALSHVSFPETDPAAACFTPVRYTADAITVGEAPPGCEYPSEAQRARLAPLADRVEAAASNDPLLACALPPEARARAAAHNARTLRAAAERFAAADATKYPYAVVAAFGYGWPDQDTTSIVNWMPGDRCHRPAPRDLARLGVNVRRARRAAEALRAGVAPLAVVSGGAVHSHMVEAFALLYLMQCLLGVRPDRVLLDPCADHTHTNVRNTGRWVAALGARAGYVVTDDGIQSDYLQDRTGFEPIGGSVDQRALRDWGYLLGAWRQAAVGPNVGFWYTPYRFWAEPRDGLGAVTCVDGG